MVIKGVSDQEELLRLGQSFRRFSRKLVNRVERHELNAGLIINDRPTSTRACTCFTPRAVRASR